MYIAAVDSGLHRVQQQHCAKLASSPYGGSSIVLLFQLHILVPGHMTGLASEFAASEGKHSVIP